MVPAAEWGQKRGLGKREGQGFGRPSGEAGGGAEGEGLKVGEGVVSFPSHPLHFPILTSQTPWFSPVATATAPARRGHQGNPVPASPPLPITGVPPPPQAAAVWRVGGAMGGKDSDSRPRMGGSRPTIRLATTPHPPPQADNLYPTAGYAATADSRTDVHPPPPTPRHHSQAAATPQHITGLGLSTPTTPPPPPASALHQAPPTVLCRRPPIPEEA